MRLRSPYPPLGRPPCIFERAHEQEVAEHRDTDRLFNVARVMTLVLLVVVGLLTWRLFA